MRLYLNWLPWIRVSQKTFFLDFRTSSKSQSTEKLARRSPPTLRRWAMRSTISSKSSQELRIKRQPRLLKEVKATDLGPSVSAKPCVTRLIPKDPRITRHDPEFGARMSARQVQLMEITRHRPSLSHQRFKRIHNRPLALRKHRLTRPRSATLITSTFPRLVTLLLLRKRAQNWPQLKSLWALRKNDKATLWVKNIWEYQDMGDSGRI